jgi:hypothetical protein
MYRSPLEPLEYPVLRASFPLLPLPAVVAVCSRMFPLLSDELSPEKMYTLPPEEILELPARRRKDPPTPLVPDPTVISIGPPAPLAAFPVPTCSDPLDPTELGPVLNDTRPLIAPLIEPAAALPSHRLPLLESVL